MDLFFCLLIGVVGGVSSGLFGIGGGIVIVPASVMLLNLPQAKAQGTSLMALLLPVGVLGVLNYYRAGNVDMRLGGWIAAGFFFGTLAGSRVALTLPEATLRRVFACLLAAVALQMFLKK